MAQEQQLQVNVALDTKGAKAQAQQFFSEFESKQINFRVNSQPLGQISADIKEIDKSLAAANARVIAFGASVSILSAISSAFKNLVTDTIAVEKALAQINNIVGTSTAGLKEFSNGLFDVSRNTATAFREAAEAATEFSRQGLGLEEILRRTNDALILSRLSGLGLQDSLKGLTTAVNTFGSAGLTTTDILNKLAKVDAAFAVSSRDLIEGFRRSGAAADSAKVNFDELNALITSLQQTTQRGGGIIGNAIKSIFTRIERPQVLDDLQQLGVATKDVNGASLSAIDVLTNLARTYDKLGESQRSAVAEQVGGLFQINLLKSALKDLGGGYSVYSAALQTSLSATNEAIVRNQELNKTLAALAVQTGQSAAQAGAKVGAVTVAPAISNVLNTANNALQSVSDTLDGKGIGGKLGAQIANGILDVIGQTLSGPGLLVIGALITKLTIGIAGSLRQAFTSIAGQNTAIAEQAALQREIQGTLASNPELYNKIASGASSVLLVERELLELTEARTAALRAQQAVAASLSAGLYGAGLRAVPPNQGGGYTTRAGGLLPEEEQSEKMAAYGAGYEPGEVKAMDVKNMGRVVYNTSEIIKNFPGFDQPAIMPPKGSRGATNYEKMFKQKYGFNPYAAEGMVPNYAMGDNELNTNDFIHDIDEGGNSLGQSLKIGFLSSRGGKNPLFKIVDQLKKNELHQIDAGSITGPRIPAILAGLMDKRAAGRLGDAKNFPINLTGNMFPAQLVEEAENQRSSPLSEYKMGDNQINELHAALSKLGVDQHFFKGGQLEGLPFRFNYTVADGMIPNSEATLDKKQKLIREFLRKKQGVNPLGTTYEDISKAGQVGSTFRFGAEGEIPNFASLSDFLNLFGGATTPENGGLAKIASRGTRGLAIRSMVGLHEEGISEAALGGDLKRLLSGVSPSTLQKLVESGAIKGVSGAHIDALKNSEAQGFVPNYAAYQDSFDPSIPLDIYSRMDKPYSDLSLAATRGNKEVGALSARLYPDQARITSIGVDKAFRGQGISSELYKRLIDEGIGGSRKTISGALTPQYDENNDLKGVYPQLTRARFGKYSDLHFDDRDIRQSFKIRAKSYEQDLARIAGKLAGKPFGESFPELETHFAKGMVPNFSIGEAMSRERASLAAMGYTPQQVNNSIRYAPSSDLPNGGVYNTLQESSITDGVNAAKVSGINPVTKGFTPNFAAGDDEFLRAFLSGGASQEARRVNPNLFGQDEATLGPASRLGTAGQVPLRVDQQQQLNPSGLSLVPPKALQDISELGQAILKIGTTAQEAKKGITQLSDQEERAVRARIGEIEATELGSEELQKRIQLIRSDVQSSNVAQAGLAAVRGRAINGPSSFDVSERQSQRELDVANRLTQIIGNTGDKFRGNDSGLSGFENQQTARLNRQAALADAQSASRGNNPTQTGQITAFQDLITRARLGLNDLTQSRAAQTVASPLRSVGNTLARNQLPIIFGTEAITAGLRQTLGPNSAVTAGAEAVSTAASTGALIASFSPIAGAATAGAIALYKLVDAFSGASIRLRELDEKVESQKKENQQTAETGQNFLSGRGALQDAINNGANPRDVSRLANKDQENFNKLTPNLQSAVAGLIDPKQIAQVINDEIEKQSKSLASLSSEQTLLTDRKTVFSTFGGRDSAAQTEAQGSYGVKDYLQDVINPVKAFQDLKRTGILSGADDLFRGNNQFGRFDRSAQGDVRLQNTVGLLQQIKPKEEIEAEQANGTLGASLKAQFGFSKDDVKALTDEFAKLSKTQEQNVGVIRLQNQRLVENSQVQNQLTKSIDLYNKSLLQNAAILETIGARAINRQRAGNQIISGQEETQNTINDFSAKKRIDLLVDSLGVGASGKSNLEANNSVLEINNQRALGLNQLGRSIGPEVQESLLNLVTKLSASATSENAKQKLQTVDAEGAAEANGTSLNTAQNRTTEAIKSLPSALQAIAKTGNITDPAEAIKNIQSLITDLQGQANKTTSPEVALDIQQQINKLQGIENSLATGFAQLNQTAQKQLQETIINNEYTQRIIELNRNRTAGGGIEGFEDFNKRIGGFTDALPGFTAALQRANAAGPNVAGQGQLTGAQPADIGALLPFVRQAQALEGGGKGEITEEFAKQLADANAGSINAAARDLLGKIGQAANTGPTPFDKSAIDRLDLSKYTNQFSNIQDQRTRISDKILDSTTDVDEKQRLRAQNDALAKQQQDIISQAKQDVGGTVGGFNSNPTVQNAIDTAVRSAISASVRSREIGRDQINGAFDVIGADKKVNVNSLNTTLDTGKQTVSELIKLSDRVLSSADGKEYLTRVTNVAEASRQLEARIQSDVALIKVAVEKNQLENKQTALTTAQSATNNDLQTRLGASTTFQDLAAGKISSGLGGSVAGERLAGAQSNEERLAKLLDLAGEIKAGNTGEGLLGRGQLEAKGFNPGGKDTGEILNQLLQFVAKTNNPETTGAENNQLRNIGNDFSRLQTLNVQLVETNKALEPLTQSFEKLKTTVQELGKNSVETGRKDVVGSITGKDNKDAANAIFGQADSLRTAAQALKQQADQNPKDKLLQDSSDKANSDLAKFLSNAPEKLKNLGSTVDNSSIALALEGLPSRGFTASTATQPAAAPTPSSQPGTSGFKSNSQGFYNSLADLQATQVATYRNKPGESALVQGDENSGYTSRGRSIPGYLEGPGAIAPVNQEQLLRTTGVIKDQASQTTEQTAQTAAQEFIRSLTDGATILKSAFDSGRNINPNPAGPVTQAGENAAAAAANSGQTPVSINAPITVNQGKGSVDIEAIVSQFKAYVTQALSAAGINAPVPPGGPAGKEGQYNPNP